MNSANKKQKEHSKLYIIVVGIGALILALPIYAVMCINDFFKNKKHKKGTSYVMHSSERNAQPLMHYSEPQTPVEDREFISRIDEFVCFQYKSFNGLSGRGKSFQLFASESPELKEYVLKFLANHSIEELLYGNINCNGCDMDDWEICIIFEDENLNRCIRGYGTTDVSAPFLRELVPYLFRKQDSMCTLDHK